jgi:auxin efflux carrier family protein
LHWDKIPGDNDDEVAARGILYLLIFQQLGQLVRWSWGYHVLLAPPESYENSRNTTEEGRYRDEPELIAGLDGEEEDTADADYLRWHRNSSTANSFESGDRTPVSNVQYAASFSDDGEARVKAAQAQANGNKLPNQHADGNITSFPSIRTPSPDEEELPGGIPGLIAGTRRGIKRAVSFSSHRLAKMAQSLFNTLPPALQDFITTASTIMRGFFVGAWEFMNPPLWAMLVAVIVASIPSLQRLFFEEGTFISNSVTRAVSQSGGVAVPLILVVLGANLARNTNPKEDHIADSEESQIGTKLLVASLISRMLLPTIVMAPLLALTAKYIPISIVDDPIFVIVCFLLTGAPSALQLAQICQINGVYEGVMSKLLFQSYVIWYVYT